MSDCTGPDGPQDGGKRNGAGQKRMPNGGTA
jgi:hypothetical protein